MSIIIMWGGWVYTSASMYINIILLYFSSANTARSCVAVSEVQDIEENIWSPRYGFNIMDQFSLLFHVIVLLCPRTCTL